MRAYMCIYEYTRLNCQIGAPGVPVVGTPGALLVSTPGALPVGTPVPYACDKCKRNGMINVAVEKVTECKMNVRGERIVSIVLYSVWSRTEAVNLIYISCVCLWDQKDSHIIYPSLVILTLFQ